jgi:pectin methylesterase-like acyl-CoA thioesterase
VELHFETGNPRWNQAMLSEVVKYTRLIEQKTGEKVYVQRNWGRPVVWSRLYLANTRLDNVDELKKWASEKMIIFYRILQPRLKELR